MDGPEPTPEEIAQASAELAGVVAAIVQPPSTYVSNREGRIPIDQMDSTHAQRAAKAVAEGRRPANPPSAVKPLREQARKHQRGGL